jgi:signal transduction histidine kinase
VAPRVAADQALGSAGLEPFYQSPALPEKRAGSGLGLALARGFVEANGGRIWVESTHGQGSTFVVELPTMGVAR